MGVKDISTRLLYYKRDDIRQAICESAKDREVAVRFLKGFGKRPDVLEYKNDVFMLVKKGATSFHVSEEIWENPLDIRTGMSKEELNSMRKGWDLIIDIDCPYWFFSKLTTHLFIKALKNHDITSISCKFSGNKGFHIGVPFKAFPNKVDTIPIKEWFPEGPRRIAAYLLSYISENLIKVNGEEVIFDDSYKFSLDKIHEITGKPLSELTMNICSRCKKKIRKSIVKKEFICPNCELRVMKTDDTKFMSCPKCNTLMERIVHGDMGCSCGEKKILKVFDPLSIVEVDTLLISSRHLYRMPYSMHEKSGLYSLPINPFSVMSFEKKDADPDAAGVSEYRFLDDSLTIEGEANVLLMQAIDHNPEIKSQKTESKNYEFFEVEDAIPLELFPPCIIKILEGIGDGKKRALFALTNFLSTCGWSNEAIEGLIEEWNKRNPEPLRDNYVDTQMKYHKARNKKILPPNCKNFYQDFQVCFPDNLCERIKNPSNYAIRKSKYLNKRKGKRLTEQQKEMRRRYRKLKNEHKTIQDKDKDKEKGA